MGDSHVLVPLVGTPDEDTVSRALAVHDADRVTVCNVVTPLDAGMSESGVLEREGRVEEAREVAMERAAAARGAADADTTLAVTAARGPPVETVTERAARADVDAVAVEGLDGPDPLRRLFGTTARAIATEAPVPVTVLD